MGHGCLRFPKYGDGPHIITFREGALAVSTASIDDGRHTQLKSSNLETSDVRAVPEVGLAAIEEQGHVLLCVLPVLDAGHWRGLYYSFTRGKTTLGPRPFSAKFVVFVGWVSCFFLRFVAREETLITSQLERINTSNHHIPQRHRHALQFLYDL